MEALKERGILRQNAPHLVQRPGLRRAELRLVGGAVLRHRPEGLRRAGRQVRLRRLADPLARGDARRLPTLEHRGPARRRRLLRRPVRRLRGCSSTWSQTAAEQGATLLNYARGDRLHTGRATGSWTASSPSTRRPASEIRVERAGRHQRDRARSRTASAGWTIPAAPPMIAPSQGVHLVFDRLVPAGRHRHHGAAHARRPRDVRHPVARPHAGRHHRHADRRADARAAARSTRRSTSSSKPPASTCTEPPTRADVLSVFVGHPAARARRRRRRRPRRCRATTPSTSSGRACSRSPAASGPRTATWPRTA